jgi:hypothetical protein
LALLLVAPLVLAKDKPTIPKLIVNARFVQVTTYLGDDPANVRIMPEDRQAVADVQNAIQKWGRYTRVYQANDADLIILVRKGRIAEATSGVRVHVGSEKPSPTVGSVLNADAGDPQDTLAVYDAEQGIDSAPLWRGRKDDGLNPPDMALVTELRSRVEGSAKHP